MAADGREHRNSVATRRGIAVAGTWLIFGPPVPFLLLGLAATLSNLIAPGRAYACGDDSWATPVRSPLGLEL